MEDCEIIGILIEFIGEIIFGSDNSYNDYSESVEDD
ncbi:uncharacterized protein LOC133850268 [Drosophila sulfurigaster albostrigata]|uniref:Uncharacterized protein LOC117565321 n=1 Tax=Drosophila albomicans TaxID=7291 RepID=A0A6P8XPT9_DROAB|nr:uncharacterized protein LOC117565321 [Drosophila albomicans]XP_060644983.1 uncharacterized protein LOC132783676 [Drosophila nasuta]XP_062142299.1 uncharacterized protein LOC133850268 [Drosophila sulfurigaster albostrigata]